MSRDLRVVCSLIHSLREARLNSGLTSEWIAIYVSPTAGSRSRLGQLESGSCDVAIQLIEFTHLATFHLIQTARSWRVYNRSTSDDFTYSSLLANSSSHTSGRTVLLVGSETTNSLDFVARPSYRSESTTEVRHCENLASATDNCTININLCRCCLYATFPQTIVR